MREAIKAAGCVCAVLSIACFSPRHALSSEPPDIVFETAWHIFSDSSDQYKAVYRVDLGKMLVREIYHTDYNQIADLAVSPDKDSVAVLATRIRSIDGEPEVHNKITVIDGEGQIKCEIMGAAEGIAWSPDGKALAYTMGVPIENAGFRSTGTFLRDSVTGESEKIYDKGLLLHWAAFDKRLYIMNDYDLGEVVVYDPVDRSVNETPYTTINLSPDGKLYWVPKSEGSGSVGLISTEDGEDLSCRYTILKGDIPYHFLRWLNARMLAFPGPGKCTHLFSVSDGRTLKVQGNILAIRGDDIYVSVPIMRLDKIKIGEAELLNGFEHNIMSLDPCNKAVKLSQALMLLMGEQARAYDEGVLKVYERRGLDLFLTENGKQWDGVVDTHPFNYEEAIVAAIQEAQNTNVERISLCLLMHDTKTWGSALESVISNIKETIRNNKGRLVGFVLPGEEDE